MAPLPPLSNRERDVVQLLLEGKSNKQIAYALNISVSTVEFHLKNIYGKYQVNSRTELILLLGNPPAGVEDEKLGQSVVADEGEVADNRDMPNSWMNRATSLRAVVSRIGKESKMKDSVNSQARDESNPMTFFESIIVCLTKYAEFGGRASRSEFWWFALFVILVTSALMYLSEAWASVFLIAVLLPILAAGSRRLHDIDKSGWLQLYLLVPVGGLVVLGYFWSLPSTSLQPDDTLPA